MGGVECALCGFPRCPFGFAFAFLRGFSTGSAGGVLGSGGVCGHRGPCGQPENGGSGSGKSGKGKQMLTSFGGGKMKGAGGGIATVTVNGSGIGSGDSSGGYGTCAMSSCGLGSGTTGAGWDKHHRELAAGAGKAPGLCVRAGSRLALTGAGFIRKPPCGSISRRVLCGALG